jgi:hypothetical protein
MNTEKLSTYKQFKHANIIWATWLYPEFEPLQRDLIAYVEILSSSS